MLVTLAAALVLAGCSNGSEEVVRPPPSNPTSSSRTLASATTPPLSTSTTTTLKPGSQMVTVTPSAGLRSSEVVHVTATGFSPNQPLIVIECADKGIQTGQGDCNLNGAQSVTSGANGDVTAGLTVLKGPFGANSVVCGPAQACLVSVSQAIPTPTEQASTPINFG